MFKPLSLGLLLLSASVSTSKIDFNSPNEVVLDGANPEMTMGSVEEFNSKLSEAEKVSDLAINSRMEVRTTRPGSIQDSYYNAMVASTTYCEDNQTLFNWSCKSCTKLGKNLKLHKILDEPKFKTRALIYLDDTNKRIVLAFRGTVNLINWFKNFETFKTKFPVTKGAEVHKGIKDMSDKLQFLYNPEVASLRANITYKDYDIVVVGHSLGGALAIFASIYLQQEQVNLNWSKIQTFTYGQPRVGNQEFVRWFNTKDTTVTRVVHASDVVPHAPPMLQGYSHAFTEMYVKDDKTYVCGQTYLEDPNCSNSNVPFLSWENHLKVWDIELGIGSC